MNAKKTKDMTIGAYIDHKISINNAKLEHTATFKYLRSIKPDNNSCTENLRTRIAIAEQIMIQLNSIRKDQGRKKKKIEKKILKSLLRAVVVYGCKAWTPFSKSYRCRSIGDC